MLTSLDPDILHPAARADSLYFLDTLEHFVPSLSPLAICSLLPLIRRYLHPRTTSQKHLESAHSVFLSILARGDILHDQTLPYLDQVYSVLLLQPPQLTCKAFPQALSPRQVRLAFSTVVKLSSDHQATIILDNLLRHAQTARTDPLPLSMGAENTPMDEQLTYLLAFIDCMPWISADTVVFWFDQFDQVVKPIEGPRGNVLVGRLMDVVMEGMGGEVGFAAFKWWVNGGSTRILTPKL